MLETLPKNIELQNHILPKPRIKSDAGMKRYNKILEKLFFYLLINLFLDADIFGPSLPTMMNIRKDKMRSCFCEVMKKGNTFLKHPRTLWFREIFWLLSDFFMKELIGEGHGFYTSF